jgi:hypothetical protein
VSPEEENKMLLGAAAEVAQKQLEQGRFLSFAATLGSKRNAKTIFTDDLEPDASREEIGEYWARELRELMADADVRVACYCARGRVQLGESAPVPCLLVHIEHVEGGAHDCVFPYGKDQASKFVFGKPLSRSAPREIFAG